MTKNMKDIKNIKVALLCIRGLPAQYGAYDQTSHELVTNEECSNYEFIVPCDKSMINTSYDKSNVKRIFLKKRDGGLGTILYGVKGTLLSIISGARTLVFFGYGLAPIFPLLRLFGLKVICNVDGIEWKRAKWSLLAKFYFKLCEFISAYTPILRVYDAAAIKNYYLNKYNANGTLIFYGSDTDELKNSDDENNKTVLEEEYAIVVMRMEPENNILHIVNGFANNLINMKLKIIGPSTNFFEQSCIPIINQSENIDYLGSIYDRELLIKQRSNACLYVHGHSVGGTNPTLVEACHIGRPVVAHNNEFNREVLGESGLFFSSAEDLTEIIKNEQWRNISPPQLSSDYDWCNISRKYSTLFKL
jgi:glycosyltransferase involved in cell wall biosynthesis